MDHHDIITGFRCYRYRKKVFSKKTANSFEETTTTLHARVPLHFSIAEPGYPFDSHHRRPPRSQGPPSPQSPRFSGHLKLN